MTSRLRIGITLLTLSLPALSAMASGPAIIPIPFPSADFSVPLAFPDTPVGTTSTLPCFPIQCPGCRISIVQSPAPPFQASNYRQTSGFDDCEGTPVTPPLTLGSEGFLVFDIAFAPTSRGMFTSALEIRFALDETGITFGYQLSGTGVQAPHVAVSASPTGMLQLQNTGGAIDSYVLTNAGSDSTSITLTQNGSFFTQSPTTFSLAPGQSQTISINGTAQPAGEYNGASIPAGAGVPAGLSIPVKLLSAAPPAGTVIATPATNRPEVSGPPGSNPTGSVSFRNDGVSTLQGILVSDSAWLVPQTGGLTISPGASADALFSIDDSRRPDGNAPLGTVTGKLSLSYLTTSAGKTGITPSATTTAITSVVIAATSVPTVAAVPIPGLDSNEIALFIPGVAQGTDRLTDAFVSNTSSTLNTSPVRLFYIPARTASTSASSTTVAQLQSNAPVAFTSIVKSVFGIPSQTGTLQLRTSNVDRIAFSSLMLNLSSPRGSFGTALPVFRSDRGVFAGDKLFLPGLRKDATGRTDLYIQETGGEPSDVQVEFYSAAGARISTRASESVPAFGLLELTDDAIPTGAVSAAVVSGPASGGQIVATAIMRDSESGDPSAITATESNTLLVIPLAITNSSTRTEVAIMNTDDVPASGVLAIAGSSVAGRRRSVRRTSSAKGGGAIQPSAPQTINLAPFETRIISNAGSTLGGSGNSYLTFTPSSGSVAISSRIISTQTGRAGSWGSSVLAVPASSAMKQGGTRAFAGLGDSTATTIAAAKPLTFRTSFGFAEVTGASAVVRATVRYTFPAGAAQARAVASRDFPVKPNELIFKDDMVKAIIGNTRDTTVGDLTNVQITFTVVSGSGGIVPFVRSIDNGSGDSIVRVE